MIKSIRLGDITSVITKGTTPTSVGFDFSDCGVPFLRVQNLVDGAVDLTKTPLYISDATHRELARSTIYPGDLLISIAGTIGRAAIVADDAIEMNSNQAVGIVRFNEGVHRRYILHALQSHEAKKQILGAQVTATISNLSLTELRNLQIPLPPLAEQKRIAAILDKADAIRRKLQQSLRLSDDFLRSVFLDMFGDPVTNPKGWDKTTVGEAVEFLTSGSRGWAQYYADEGDFFIRIQNLRGGFLDLSDSAFVNAPESAEARRTRVRPGDVLLSITADLGRTAVVPEKFGKGHINQHLAILRLKEMNPVFVSHLLASPGGQRQFAALNRSAVKAGLNFDDIRSITLLCPPTAIQKKFAAIVAKLQSHLQNLLHPQLAESKALFSSLQQRAFRGEL